MGVAPIRPFSFAFAQRGRERAGFGMLFAHHIGDVRSGPVRRRLIGGGTHAGTGASVHAHVVVVEPCTLVADDYRLGEYLDRRFQVDAKHLWRHDGRFLHAGHTKHDARHRDFLDSFAHRIIGFAEHRVRLMPAHEPHPILAQLCQRPLPIL